MTLLTSEVEEIRYELGYNVLSVGAEPYISYVAVFEQVIQAFLEAGATTTSSTAVTAVAPPAVPTPVALTLASIVGFNAGDRVVLDVDIRQETATIESIAGSAITVYLLGAHSGTYPVAQQGGETIVRQRLVECRLAARRLEKAGGTAGIAQADEVKFFAYKKKGSSRFRELADQREYFRNELASALGVQNLRSVRRGAGAGGSPVLY